MPALMPIPAGRGRRMVLSVLVAVVLQTFVAVLVNLPKLRAPAPGAPGRFEDTDIYYGYATSAFEGKIPYRDFRVEYPPLAIPAFLAPRAVSRSLEGYKRAFAVEMLVFNALTVCLVACRVENVEGLGRVRARLAWYTLYFCLLSKFMISRFDAVPMFLGFATAVWWALGRERLGGLLAAIGTMVKFYPALMAVVFCPKELSRPGTSRCRGTAVFAVTMSLGVMGWVALGGVGGVLRSLGYHAGRGFEYGSLYAGVQMLAAKAIGAEIVVARDHASYSSYTAWTPRLLPLVFPIQGAAILLVELVFLRRGMKDGVRYCGAAVLGFIVTGKVFSPQYLIWLMPFFASARGSVGRRGRWIFAAGCLATLLAPSGTPYFPRTTLWIILPYNLKNALFLGLFVQQVFGRSDETG